MSAAMTMLQQIAAAPLPADTPATTWIFDDELRQWADPLDEAPTYSGHDVADDTPRHYQALLHDGEAKALMDELMQVLKIHRVDVDAMLGEDAADHLPCWLPMITADHLRQIMEALQR